MQHALQVPRTLRQQNSCQLEVVACTSPQIMPCTRTWNHLPIAQLLHTGMQAKEQVPASLAWPKADLSASEQEGFSRSWPLMGPFNCAVSEQATRDCMISCWRMQAKNSSQSSLSTHCERNPTRPCYLLMSQINRPSWVWDSSLPSTSERRIILRLPLFATP